MSVASNALAVLAPAALLAAAVAWLGAEVPRPLSDAARAIDASLAARPPDVVVVGNSKVLSDVSATELGPRLGGEVATIQVPASAAPAWYALLEQRVYAHGHAPELVVVYGTLAGMLTTQVEGALDRKRLDEQLTTESPVLDAKLGGAGTGLGARARRRATALRLELLEGVRDVAVGLALAPERTPAAGRAVAVPALDAVFGGGAKFVSSGRARVIPVAEATQKLSVDASSDPSQSLLADFVALAGAHGARVVFVRAPLPPSARYLDDVPVERERAALEIVNGAGAGWLDLRATPLGPPLWQDDLHLTRPGRTVVTDALARALEGVATGGALPEGRMPVAPSAVRRTGTPPAIPSGKPVRAAALPCAWHVPLAEWGFLADTALEQAGLGRASPIEVLEGGEPLAMHAPKKAFGTVCAGAALHEAKRMLVSPRESPEAPALSLRLAEGLPLVDPRGKELWWVYPGTTLELAFDEPWDRGPFMVDLRARVLGEGSATLVAGGVEAALGPRGRLQAARVEAPAPEGSWSIQLRATGWVAVEALTVGETERVAIIGTDPGPVNLLAARGTPAADPPPVTLGRVTDGSPRRVALPSLATVADDVMRARVGANCSPVRFGVVADGGPSWLPDGHRQASVVASTGRGWSHTGAEILYAQGEGALVADLDPARKCGTFHWIYPGDTLRYAPSVKALEQLGLGADRVDLDGAAFGGDGRVLVRVRSRAGDVRASGEAVFPTDGTPSGVRALLDRPVPARTKVDVELERPADGGFVLLRGALLVESEAAP